MTLFFWYTREFSGILYGKKGKGKNLKRKMERTKRIKVICFTRAGVKLGQKIIFQLREAGFICDGYWKSSRNFKELDLKEKSHIDMLPIEEPLPEWVGRQFFCAEAFVFVGAAGIAVRALAPWIQDKYRDPAVVVADEKGQFVISVLSGHMGGGNALARRISSFLHAFPVITTATDVRGEFAVDEFAKKYGFWISSRELAKQISAELLDDKTVGIISHFPIEGELPKGCQMGGGGSYQIDIGGFCRREEEKTLFLVPKRITLGIGCRKGITAEDLEKQVVRILEEKGIWLQAVERVATIELKKEEPALLQLCRKFGWEFCWFTAEELQAAEGNFSHSAFVEKTVGVGNVCERAAVLGSGGKEEELIIRKQMLDGMTIAAAYRNPEMVLQFFPKKLRFGYTTGTCAACASLAAASLLFLDKKLEVVHITTPKGIELDIKVESWERGKDFARCAVRKFAGDDPDITDGILIFAEVFSCEEKRDWQKENWYMDDSQERRPFSLFLRGGEGVGRITRKGLSCPVGMWAINPVPRSMIFEQVSSVCQAGGISGQVCIVIEIPEGKKRAEKTFNPRLGVEGGLSILGSSGIVEPMSERALLETIRLEIRQKAAEGRKVVAMVPGNYGEQFLFEHMRSSDHTKKPEQNGLFSDEPFVVKCSNFIGNSIDMAAEEGIEALLLVGHAGKLLKVAAGVMNTHSSAADGRMECLAAYGAACGASREMVQEILTCITADEALAVLERREGLREDTMEEIMKRISLHLKRRAGSSLWIEAIVFTKERGILGMTEGAEKLMNKLHLSLQKKEIKESRNG